MSKSGFIRKIKHNVETFLLRHKGYLHHGPGSPARQLCKVVMFAFD